MEILIDITYRNHFHCSSGTFDAQKINSGLCASHSTSALFPIAIGNKASDVLPNQWKWFHYIEKNDECFTRMAKDSCKTWAMLPRGNAGPAGEWRGAPGKLPLALAESVAPEWRTFSIFVGGDK